MIHVLGKENISPPRKKNMIHRYVSKKMLADRGLKNKHHRVTPIDHFLIDMIQILFKDWIENTIADIGRCKSATDIFQPTLHNFFCKRTPVIFFYDRGCFIFGVAIKIYNVGRLGFFVRAQPKLCFDWHRHVFICLAWKPLTNLGKKTWFTDTDRKKF